MKLYNLQYERENFDGVKITLSTKTLTPDLGDHLKDDLQQCTYNTVKKAEYRSLKINVKKEEQKNIELGINYATKFVIQIDHDLEPWQVWGLAIALGNVILTFKGECGDESA